MMLGAFAAVLAGGGGVGAILALSQSSHAAVQQVPAVPRARAQDATPRLFVAIGGSDANPCTASSPCATFNAAYQLASDGQVVEVAAGTYGPQDLLGPRGARTKYVVFRPAQGAVVSTGELRLDGAEHVEFDDMTVDDYYVAQGSHDVVFRDLDAHVFFIRSADDVFVVGGRVGGTTHAESATIGSTAGSTQPSQNVVIDGVEFHDMTRADAPTDHTECLFLQSVDGLVLRNSRFHGCDVFDVYVSNILVGPVSSNLLIENNFFGSATDGGFYTLFARLDSGDELQNAVIRNNSFAQGIHLDPGSYQNVLVAGNVGPMLQHQCTPGVDYSHNVWQGARCSATDTSGASGFGDPDHLDLHLVRGAPPIGRGDPASYPARDIDGDLRPRLLPPDAGADQRETAELALGRSIGAVRVGAPTATVTAFYGAPPHVGWRRLANDQPRLRIASYREHGGRLEVISDGDRVVGVTTSSRYYRSLGGVGPGVDVAALRGFTRLGRTSCGLTYRKRVAGVDTYASVAARRVTRVAMMRPFYGAFCGAVRGRTVRR
jgi:hypothetical protein